VRLIFLFYFPAYMLTCRSREARVEFGDEVASRLKLSPDGKTVLWPQPTDDPEDPQNVRLRFHLTDIRPSIDCGLLGPLFQWSERRKTVQLIIITLASVVPDFDSAIGQCESRGAARLN
jgi:hypothetical protein